MMHSQPALEQCIRDVSSTHATTDIRFGCAVVGMSEDEEFVHVTYTNEQGTSKHLKCKFAVGCGGKTGFIRKQYLESRGIVMERNTK